MFVAAQDIILKSVLFKNLMRAFTMYLPCIFSVFLKLSYFQNYMRAVDQKHNYQLEWPKSFTL